MNHRHISHSIMQIISDPEQCTHYPRYQNSPKLRHTRMREIPGSRARLPYKLTFSRSQKCVPFDFSTETLTLGELIINRSRARALRKFRSARANKAIAAAFAFPWLFRIFKEVIR